MISSVAPTRLSTFCAYLITKIGNRNLKSSNTTGVPQAAQKTKRAKIGINEEARSIKAAKIGVHSTKTGKMWVK